VLVSEADPITRLTRATTDAQALLDDYTANRDSAILDPRYVKVF
jgi:hypothetical protein